MERGWEGRRPGKGPSLRSQPLHAGKVPLSTGNPYHLKSPGALAYAMGGCGALTGAVPRRREQVRLGLRATEGTYGLSHTQPPTALNLEKTFIYGDNGQ